ncbi:TatD family hydrolase [Beggiatoa leptomitoformis]|uniref:YchF/TatD family DNA exonuclease n=1 Tax=Beggiatoa leptomitoformis TaxID=288004 RepID=A0A2N9YGI4_9GAMM|nr:TatD family hydrolase [Beggiatoa leptomitoformis]ALG68077.1 YchF/TatD family DNA exonuclease [Beggiatoa leptomitoformis]AUI69632.1 YchF/TatD family DNA exonuclease [Beggiatoa leptomitoformis]
MLVDSHCHLDLVEKISPDVLIANAQQAGVSHFLCVAVDLHNIPAVIQVAEQHATVYASVGIHPNSARDNEPDVERLIQLAQHPKVIAIGETGLDYYRSEGDLSWQKQRFRTHIAAAKATGKPLIIHCREAKADTLQILREEKAHEVGGIMHCFVEDWETARQAMDMNFYISFSGIVTFKTAMDLKAVARQMPLDYLLVETDAPYLAPVPFRGKLNQPAYVKQVAEHIADLKGESFVKIASVTTENFFRLFNKQITH